MTGSKDTKYSSWGSLKAAFRLNERNKEYGPYFIQRQGNDGDVGYPPGFAYTDSIKRLEQAYDTVEQIISELKSIIYGTNLSTASAKGYQNALIAIEEIKAGIFEFYEKLEKSVKISESDMKDFAKKIVDDTSKCLEDLKSCEHNCLMQAAVRGLADVLQISRIPSFSRKAIFGAY